MLARIVWGTSNGYLLMLVNSQPLVSIALMVGHHWSDDGMVTVDHRRSLICGWGGEDFLAIARNGFVETKSTLFPNKCQFINIG